MHGPTHIKKVNVVPVSKHHIMYQWHHTCASRMYIDMSDQATHSELLLKESGSSAIHLSTLIVNLKKTYRLHHSHCTFHVALKINKYALNRNNYIPKRHFVKEISHFGVATSSYIYKYTVICQSNTTKLYYVYYCIWPIYHCIFIYVLKTSGWQTLNKFLPFDTLINFGENRLLIIKSIGLSTLQEIIING